MEIRYPVNQYMVDMKCNVCNKGVMRPTGETLLSNPQGYIHRCENCGKLEVYTCVYPHIETECMTNDKEV